MNALEFLELLKSEPKVPFKVGDKVAVYDEDEQDFSFATLQKTEGYYKDMFPLSIENLTFTVGGKLRTHTKLRNLFHIEEVKPIGLQIPPEFLSRFPDKSPVLVWDDGQSPQIRFWDAENDCTFQSGDGGRAGFKFDNYKPLSVEALKELWGEENYQKAYDRLED